MRARIELGICGLLLVACGPSIQAETPSDLIVGCGALDCGLNGAWLGNNVEFYELDASGQAFNAAHLRISSVNKGDQKLRLDVDRDHLIGIPIAGTPEVDGTPHLTNDKLIGTEIHLQLDSSVSHGKKVSYTLEITNITCTSFWTEPAGAAGMRPCTWTRGEVPLYEIEFAPDDLANCKSCRRSLCGPSYVPGGPTIMEAMTVMFRGDRYDGPGAAQPYTVRDVGATNSWFNIACVKTTLSKLHLQRHTRAASDVTHTTTVPQRQALLKLLVADYCGSGKTFTTNGRPLRYDFLQPFHPAAPPFVPNQIASLEAIWRKDGRGAECVGVPRMVSWNAIQHECRRANHPISRCQSPQSGLAGWLTRGYAVSGNP